MGAIARRPPESAARARASLQQGSTSPSNDRGDARRGKREG